MRGGGKNVSGQGKEKERKRREFTLAVATNGDGAARGSVEGHLVLDTDVDAFNDVYLAAGWPVRANDPAVIKQVSVKHFHDVSHHR